MAYTNRTDEFDGTEYDNTIADLRDEVGILMEDLRSEREQRERSEARAEELLEDLREEGALCRAAEDRVHYVEDQLDSALRLLEGILEDVSSDIRAHDRGARTGADGWELLRDIAARLREVV